MTENTHDKKGDMMDTDTDTDMDSSSQTCTKTSKSGSVLRAIGDLDHPFYDDERNRFVWYEASAIGFQLLLGGIFLLVGAMLWIAGAEALPYAVPTLLLASASAGVVLTVVSRNSAEFVPSKSDFLRTRAKIAIAIVTVLLTGAIRAWLDLLGSADGGFFGGLVVGAPIGLGLGIVGIMLSARQNRRAALARATIREDRAAPS